VTAADPSLTEGDQVYLSVDESGYLRTTSVGGGADAVTIANGADVAEGATTDAAIYTDTTGTVSGKLRGLVKILAAVADIGSGWLKVSIQNATLAVTQSGTWSFATGKTVKTFTGSISANTSIVTAVPGKRIKVTAYSVLTAYSAGTISPIFTDGNAGTTLWRLLLQAISGSVSGANLAKPEPAFLFATSAGNALYLDPNGQTVVYSISYYDDDAT
jgi:hypothetical protein